MEADTEGVIPCWREGEGESGGLGGPPWGSEGAFWHTVGEGEHRGIFIDGLEDLLLGGGGTPPCGGSNKAFWQRLLEEGFVTFHSTGGKL